MKKSKLDYEFIEHLLIFDNKKNEKQFCQVFWTLTSDTLGMSFPPKIIRESDKEVSSQDKELLIIYLFNQILKNII